LPKQLIKQDLSTLEKIIGHLPYVRYLVTTILNYRRTYRNYISIILHILKKDYPVEAILRNNERIVLHNHTEAFFLTVVNGHKEIEYDISKDIVFVSLFPRFDNNNLRIKIYGAINNGDVSIFLRNEYMLPVKGKTVIDIGSNIGDSPILFALSGANRVIGIEPFPKNYELAKKNIESNNLSDRITLMLAGCASNSSYITIDPEYNSNARSVLGDDFKHGIKVPLLTLDDILTQNDLSLPNGRGNIILKMDCEGCEYQTILSASESTLQCFSHIFIEYHDGYKNLKERLEKAGFIVSVSRPIMVKDHDYFYTSHFVGYLYAKRDNDTNEI